MKLRAVRIHKRRKAFEVRTFFPKDGVLVEDPVTKIRFPKYLASSTLERDGRTYYFVDEDTRREFDKQPAAK